MTARLAQPVPSAIAGRRGGRAPRLKLARTFLTGEVLIQVSACPRCGGRHSLVAKPLANAPAILYAECHPLKQPLLFRSVDAQPLH
jgi:hypothetical protein